MFVFSPALTPGVVVRIEHYVHRYKSDSDCEQQHHGQAAALTGGGFHVCAFRGLLSFAVPLRNQAVAAEHFCQPLAERNLYERD